MGSWVPKGVTEPSESTGPLYSPDASRTGPRGSNRNGSGQHTRTFVDVTALKKGQADHIVFWDFGRGLVGVITYAVINRYL